MEPALMASTRSMTGMEVAMLESLKPVMEEDLPASLSVVLTHSTISGSVMGLSDLARRCSTERV